MGVAPLKVMLVAILSFEVALQYNNCNQKVNKVYKEKN